MCQLVWEMWKKGKRVKGLRVVALSLTKVCHFLVVGTAEYIIFFILNSNPFYT